MNSNRPKIVANYRTESEDPAKSCDSCLHFQGSDTEPEDGRCFGYAVTRRGVCDLHTAKNAVSTPASED